MFYFTIKFAEFLKKKNSTDKKKRKRRTGSPITDMNELIINENISPNHLMNGNAISDEIVANNYVNDFNDESISSESNAIQLNDTLKQRDALIKQLSERLQETLKSRNDVSQMADLMALQIEELKKQLRLVSSSILNKPVEEHPILVDFECQTEWNEESSIEYMRRQSEYDVSHDVNTASDVNTFSAVMEDKSEQTIQTENLCESEVQTDNEILHRNCREELEKAKLNLVNEFTEREKKIESELLEQINQLEQQMKRDRQTYIEESKKMDNQIFNLKSQISDIERMRRQSKSDESDYHDDDIQNFKSRVSESLSPLLPIQSDNDPRSTSRSPIHVNLQKYVLIVIPNLIYFYYGFYLINY